MFVTPHSSNELRSLDYNKIKVQNDSSIPITFNGNIIFELLPIRRPIGHFGQMQGMDHKYNGHVWCKMKTSNIKNNFGLGCKNTWCLRHLCCLNDFCEHFLHFALKQHSKLDQWFCPIFVSWPFAIRSSYLYNCL